MKLTFNNYVTLGAIFAGGVVLYKANKAGQAIKETVSKDLNPASNENIINKGVSSVGASISGNENWSLGGWIYDITHPESKAVETEIDKPSVDFLSGGTNGVITGFDDIAPQTYEE